MCTSVLHAADEVNIYPASNKQLIRSLLVCITEQTGIKVNLLSAGPGALFKHLPNENLNTPPYG